MTAQATFAGGCFWCIDAALEELDGVESTTSGYTGGHVEDPSYEEVCRETTGHAEAVRVEYDPDRVEYADLLEVFFSIHDPTTKDRQGPDVGSQYRSAVYYHDETQREIVEAFVADLEDAGVYDDPIVTEIEPVETFYVAEEYHQNYFEKNPDKPYCAAQVLPKVEKVRTEFDALTAR
ncbi:methionine sulfoxide reductase A [Salinarchaeum sp. Harcht-Bsk1]|uniref:peptide-methionine (S)-S-oxide reductase MsrA n=1 Tax=Salinarchaeum sp. Harcht-Bsk1 TaxID=1333523 RepID=UPI0003422F86|nr:peptide-methionine (S)-S-oxide reductase MsrA [Salinarchaeum sp. Harcht-Bsk1]AGN01449.1 methionine sulfoxide reductase A [Salinarchaeum sp. Harcht-Bsk1]